MQSTIHYKVATEDWEFEAIHLLNHATFAGEIPQHEPRADGRLRDKFHEDNVYLIAVAEQEVIGMLAVRTERPYSLEEKLAGLDAYLPPNREWCEIRLLAVRPAWRGHLGVFTGLLRLMCLQAKGSGVNAAVISGTTRQLKLYRHIGFVAFGPLVGTVEAAYQPMYCLLEDVGARLTKLLREEPEIINLLPGPVSLTPAVQSVLRQSAVSHRSNAFYACFQGLRAQLRVLTGARHVQVFTGSGTTANEVVAAEIRKWNRPGVIISMGEFGQRLAKQAVSWGLEYQLVSLAEGVSPCRATILAALDEMRPGQWIWTTHCETSTGIVLDLTWLVAACEQRGLRLCLDCISSLGVVPVQLGNVWLAAASSGKGLAAAAGLGIVFHLEESVCSATTPASLDLASYQANQGVPYTLNSVLVHALLTSLKTTDWSRRFEAISLAGRELRTSLLANEIPLVAMAADAELNPAVHTLHLTGRSRELGDWLKSAGYWCSYESQNLLQRNWLQICLMGGVLPTKLDRLVARVKAAASVSG